MTEPTPNVQAMLTHAIDARASADADYAAAVQHGAAQMAASSVNIVIDMVRQLQDAVLSLTTDVHYLRERELILTAEVERLKERERSFGGH